MTRGQITIIYGKNTPRIMTSVEFNGDMYMPTPKWGGHGRTVINALKRVHDVAEYQYEVAKFNKEHHHYNDLDRQTYAMDIETLDFTKDYFENWFSDYIYLKNITENPITIKTNVTDANGRDIGIEEVKLKPNAIAVLCFGSLEKLIEANEEGE